MARNKTSKAWMREHVTDQFVRKAQVDGMRSRAAYKLEQIAGKDGLLRPGMTVVDLGSAPGGWSQVAARAVGQTGKVVAIDLLDMQGIHNVHFIHGDFGDDAVLQEVEKALDGQKVDLVLSDMAPNMSGIATVDQARVAGLAELAVDFALNHLKPQGNFLVKVFQGSGFDDILKTMRGVFTSVHIRKPEASRARSSEIYLLGKGLKG